MKSIHRTEKIFSVIGYVSNVIGTMVLLIIVGNLLASISIHVINSGPEFKGDKRETLPVYDDYPNSAEFWKEQKHTRKKHFEPYYHWRRDGFKGKYINVSDDGVRRTIAPINHDDAKKLFMFGGSTMWGYGSKDEHTIPSFLQSMLGKEHKIYNYGETAYVSTQELNVLLQQLAKGNIPDAVIFYDGVNDGYAGAYSPAIPRDVQKLRMRYKNRYKKKDNTFISLYNASKIKKLIDLIAKDESTEKWDNEVSPKIKLNSLSVVNLYEAHIKQVKALGKEYGFKTFFFWQPNLFSGTRNVLPYEEAITQQASPVFVESQNQVYLDAKSAFFNRENEKIFFLGDIFNQINEPIYIDWCHIGPNGNEIVARWMYDNIKDYL